MEEMSLVFPTGVVLETGAGFERDPAAAVLPAACVPDQDL